MISSKLDLAADLPGPPTRNALAAWILLLSAAPLALTCSPPLAAAADATTAAADTTDTGGLTEITVTAERYKSTIQDTPISISALTGDQLTAAGLTRIEDIAHEVPGLSMRSAGPGLTEYEARGLASNGGAAPTVGFYLDEIPLSPPAVSQSGKVVIDPNLYDIERVEVLRGPQGTLYGSGSMGGTVKVITNQPKLGAFEGSVQGTVSDTDGGGANYGGNLMLNFPHWRHPCRARRLERPVSQRLDRQHHRVTRSHSPPPQRPPSAAMCATRRSPM